MAAAAQGQLHGHGRRRCLMAATAAAADAKATATVSERLGRGKHHAKHEVFASSCRYLPSSHAVHCVASASVLIEPRSHAVQLGRFLNDASPAFSTAVQAWPPGSPAVMMYPALHVTEHASLSSAVSPTTFVAQEAEMSRPGWPCVCGAGQLLGAQAKSPAVVCPQHERGNR